LDEEQVQDAGEV